MKLKMGKRVEVNMTVMWLTGRMCNEAAVSGPASSSKVYCIFIHGRTSSEIQHFAILISICDKLIDFLLCFASRNDRANG